MRVTVNGNTENNWASITELQLGNHLMCNHTILNDRPVGFWNVNARMSTDTDLTGNGHDGRYVPTVPNNAPLPNGESAADFDGMTQYLTIPSSPLFSLPRTHNLTVELWFRADVTNMPKQPGDGYVPIMGKCDFEQGPRCEWEARRYNLTTSQNRPYRTSAYIFNTIGKLGSGADWQPVTTRWRSI